MKPQLKMALLASAFPLSLVLATPGSATIVMAQASDFQGEEVLIDGSKGDTGLTIQGHTNQSHVAITYDGNGDMLEVQGTGQSFLTGPGDGTLTKLSYYLTNGGTFNNTEFKISDATDTIDFVITDNEGQVFNFNNVTMDPSGFIAFRGILGESIANVSFTVDNGGTFEEFRQLRLDVDEGTPPVPEPATWAMALTGFGLVGAMMRRRRVTATNTTYA